MKTNDTYTANCNLIDRQFYLGFPSASIYNAWEGHSAEIQYILDNHLDEELEVYLGISKL